MNKPTKTKPARFAPNERYNLERDVKVNKMLLNAGIIYDEFVNEEDRASARRARNMLNALFEEK
jgi:hypothetical protein